MRRWVCIIALLAGFSGGDLTRGARLPAPVPIERLYVPDGRTGALAATHHWWALGRSREAAP